MIPPQRKIDPIKRFARLLLKHGVRDLETGCVLWHGPTSHGHPVFAVTKRQRISARIWAWRLHRGEPPEGRVFAVTCRNQRCLNVAHF